MNVSNFVCEKPKTSLQEKILNARNKLKHSRCGLDHVSPIHMNSMAMDVQNKTARVYHRRVKQGDFYFLSGAIQKPTNGQWTVIRDLDEMNDSIYGPPTARMNLLDKIKVLPSSNLSQNVDRQLALSGLEGVQDKMSKKDAEIFLQEVSRYNNATVARYKRKVSSRPWHVHCYPWNHGTHTANVNMARGQHDNIVRKRVEASHMTALNFMHSTVVPLVWYDKQNNNSITCDAFISAVTNGITMKSRVTTTNEKGRFRLLHKTKFRTHKTVELHDESEDPAQNLTQNYQKRQTSSTNSGDAGEESIDETLYKRCLIPLKAREIQVHDRCFNASAVNSNLMIPVICRLGSNMFHKSNGKNVQISLALNNSKANAEKVFHSLVWSSANMFCDLLCWRLGAPDMTNEEEQYLFHKHCKPIIDMLVGTRDNYAQSESFCIHPPRGSRLFTEPILRLVSHKFHNKETNALFARSIPRNVLSPSRKRKCEENSDENHQRKKHKTRSFAMPPARNESLVKLFEMGYLAYRQRFKLIPPRLDQL